VTEPVRPDPDALLARLQAEEARETRARFKVFFGAAPGVGKTFAMQALGDREVRIDVPSDLVVQVDSVLFSQILINLVENAVKHGAPPIEIAARRRGDQVEIDVADHGPGLPPGDEERVFDKFYRASAAPGVGLGLAVVGGIVVAHGGTIAVVPGRGGARFRIALSGVGAPSFAIYAPIAESTP